MAGLYEFWRDRTLPDDHPRAWWATCTVITTEAETTDLAGAERRATRPALAGRHPPPDAADDHPRPLGRLAGPGPTDPDELRGPARPAARPGCCAPTRSAPRSATCATTAPNCSTRCRRPRRRRCSERDGADAHGPAQRRGRGPSPPRPATPAITWHRGPRRPQPSLALGHGAGGGIAARDLVALAAALPGPRRDRRPGRAALAGGRPQEVAPAPKTLDAGWTALWPELAAPGLPVVAGGRSAGARVACRTAGELGRRGRARAGLPAAPARPPGEVPGRGADRRAAALPVLGRAGRPRPVRAPGGVPGRPPSRWRCPSPTTASRCRSGRPITQDGGTGLAHRGRRRTGWTRTRAAAPGMAPRAPRGV